MIGVERVAVYLKDRAVCTQRSRPIADSIGKDKPTEFSHVLTFRFVWGILTPGD